jgi:hypothetical protein
MHLKTLENVLKQNTLETPGISLLSLENINDVKIA